MELEVRNTAGDVTGAVTVSDGLMDAPFNNSLVHQAMVMYQLNRRQGTHKVKGRAEVSGGGAKPWRQKHTGRARHGSNRSPIWRHGGVTFGPQPRSYRRQMPKRMRHMALRCMLSQKLRDSQFVLVDDLSAGSGKTKDMLSTLQALNLAGSILIVTAQPQSDVVRSARNIPRVWTLPVNLLNAYELLKRRNVLITLDALRLAEEMWAPPIIAVDESDAALPSDDEIDTAADDVEADDGAVDAAEAEEE